MIGQSRNKRLRFGLHFVTPKVSSPIGERTANLRTLEQLIGQKPNAGPVIAGTGGLRKLRFALPGNRGKSGGCRIGYAVFPEIGRVLMIANFTKDEQANFTAAQKATIRRVLDEYKKGFKVRKQV